MCTHPFQKVTPEDLSSCNLHIYPEQHKTYKSSFESATLLLLDWILPFVKIHLTSEYRKYLKWYSWSSLSLPLLCGLLHQSLDFRDCSCWHYSPPPSTFYPCLPLSLAFMPSLSVPSSFVYWHITACMCILDTMRREQDERKWPFHSLHFPLTPLLP